MEENIVFNTEDVTSNKAMGILAYLGLLVLVPIFAAKDSQYARFHANQGLVLCIATVALSIAAGIITFVASIVTFGLLAVPVTIILYLALFAFWVAFAILGILNACSGEAKKLPLLGNITIIK